MSSLLRKSSTTPSGEHYIAVRAIAGRNLVAADSNGFSDPYLIITAGKEKRKTQFIKKTLNPEWNESFNIPVNLSDTLKLRCMDKDRYSTDDFIGEAELAFDGLVKDQETVQWVKLMKVPHGEIQIGIKPITFGTPGAAPPVDRNTKNQPAQHIPAYASGNVQTSPPQQQANTGSVPAYLMNAGGPITTSTYGFEAPPSPSSSAAKSKVHASAAREGFSISYDELNFEKKIGAGAFGEVWKGEWAGTGVAIKKILKADISEDDLEEFSTEILLVSKLRHPNIVQFLGACMEPEFCLVIEFMDRGTLFDCVQQNNLTWKLKANMCADVARGMMYLHTRTPPIIHRDVKSLNILVSRDWRCTITDFGLTRIKDKAMLSTRCGSPAWSAPEVLRGEQYDEKADVYSFAIVMWEIIAQQPPYKGLNPNQVIGQVAFQSPGMRPPIPPCPYPALINLMTRLWDNDPNQRLLFPQVMEALKAIIATIQD
eukprot:CAMPEP_0117026930 /NCGR_PEP_ID=MMETSP0472-20121206/19743_1 /TAXON_ID=693140 ORGANISM="Tiarina fusus, Strain LIS" /NCGR_SAMPLE_ID=MMETSP0472 /ASSEMBLY_ACC=CAM_ASM_000603 /LENGTH=482 /DNA_ID=CAMNT_0004734057 /DNA_START=39 /DNA_END=1487 /DNA_ORIENTATION=+